MERIGNGFYNIVKIIYIRSSILFLSIFIILNLSNSVQALDSLGGIRMDMLQNDTDLAIQNVGWVENDIMFGVRTGESTDNQIKILDFAHIETTSLEGIYPRVIGNIKRTGKSDDIKFFKTGSTLFYGDSSCLRVCDIADLKNPVYIDSVFCGRAHITSINYRNDTVFVGKSVSTDYFPGLYIVTFKNNRLSLKDSFYIGGCGNDFFIDNKYFSPCGGTITVWNMPLTERTFDYIFTTSQSVLGRSSIVYKNYAFIATDSGLFVYNATDLSNFFPIDTLSVTGVVSMKIHKNLLLVFGSSLRLYDISDINNILYVAIDLVGGQNFGVDSVTNHVYTMQWSRFPVIDRIDINKYVSTVSTEKDIHKTALSGFTSPSLIYSSSSHIFSFVNQKNNASVTLINPQGKTVQKFASIPCGKQSLRLDRSVKSGIYYALINGGENRASRVVVCGK